MSSEKPEVFLGLTNGELRLIVLGVLYNNSGKVNYQKVAEKGGYTIGSAGVLYRKALKKLFEINGESLASSPAGPSPRATATRGRGGAGRGARGEKGMTTESGSPISTLKKPCNITDDGQSDANDLLPSPSMGTLDNTALIENITHASAARAKRQRKTVAQATWSTIKAEPTEIKEEKISIKSEDPSSPASSDTFDEEETTDVFYTTGPVTKKEEKGKSPYLY